MAAQSGRVYLLKLGADGSGGTVAGLRDLTATINNESVDITNKDSAGWRELGEGFGTQSVTLSAAGIATDGATFESLKGYAQANSINALQVIQTTEGDYLAGNFQVTSFQESGSHNNELSFTLTLESAGAVTFTNS